MPTLKLSSWLRNYALCFCPKIYYTVQKYRPLNSFEMHINPGIISVECLFKSHINGHYPTFYVSVFHGLYSLQVFHLRGLCIGCMATYDTTACQ